MERVQFLFRKLAASFYGPLENGISSLRFVSPTLSQINRQLTSLVDSVDLRLILTAIQPSAVDEIGIDTLQIVIQN